jgi:hypothetical protein
MTGTVSQLHTSAGLICPRSISVAASVKVGPMGGDVAIRTVQCARLSIG